MSDADLIPLLEEMEQRLDRGGMEGEEIAEWRARFDAALATAERGPEWPAILLRARALASRFDQEADRLVAAQERLRAEMDLQASGARALKGYKPS